MIRVLRWLSLCATLGLTSTFEYLAGASVPALPHVTTGAVDWSPFALLLPLAIDTYVVSALLAGHDRLFALSVLETSVLAGALHNPSDQRSALLSIVLGTVLVLVLWRVDELFRIELEEAAAAELKRETAARADAAAAADRARAEHDRRVELERVTAERAIAEATAARERAAAERAATGRPVRRATGRPPRDDLAARRDRDRESVRAEWAKADPPWSNAELGERLGVPADAARSQANRWRRQAAAQ